MFKQKILKIKKTRVFLDQDFNIKNFLKNPKTA